MSAKPSSVGNAFGQFVDKVKTSDIVRKQNDLQELLSGPLGLCREKIKILETDEAIAVLARIDANYQADLRDNVERIFDEEVSRANVLIADLDSCLVELQVLLEGILQKIQNENQKCPNLALALNCYEEARSVLTFLRLKTNLLRLKCSVSLDEPLDNSNPENSLFEKENGDFLFRLIMRRVTVYENGSTSEGRVLPILPSMPEFLNKICQEYECPDYKVLYTASGALITDVALIKNDEVLYASKGETFCPRPAPDSRNICDIFNRRNSTDWVKLNVGGQLFYTSRTTLLNSDPESMLARMFSPNSNLHPSCIDSNGAYLIDRDPRYFSPLLNYLRSGSLILDPDINPKGVLEEAYFFNIQSCIPLLEPLTIPRDEAPLSRRDVINSLIVTPNKESLRFQGVNLNGADLSYLDLRNINFKYAKLRNAKLSYCNLSYCNFERADMTDVIMNCAVLSGVRLNGAIMENAKCLNCNFQDPSGNNANMEGVNLRNAALEDSDLTGANLRVANLKGANLKATILRGAILAGADLEKSDLTGSDLHEANLRGANLKDAALELMINPLHMSQAIR